MGRICMYVDKHGPFVFKCRYDVETVMSILSGNDSDGHEKNRPRAPLSKHNIR